MVDDFVFGVAAISADGHESLVSAYGSPKWWVDGDANGFSLPRYATVLPVGMDVMELSEPSGEDQGDYRALRVRHGLAGQTVATWDRLHALAADPLCVDLLTEGINTDWPLEQFLTRARPMLWSACARDGGPPLAVRALCIALAQQAFNNEYVFAEDIAETGALGLVTADLEQAITSGDDQALVERLFLQRGLYRAPAGLAQATVLAEQLAPAFSRDLQTLVNRSLLAPLNERRLQRQVVQFGTVDDPVSRVVRQQYDDSPYPRWLRVPPPQPPIDDRIRRVIADPGWHREQGQSEEILIAGAGTGRHAIQIARDNPGSRVIAIDLSSAAIAHGLRKAAEYRVPNLSFVQGDLLELQALGRRFDHIECVGVLHHLGNHRRGWQELVDALRPGGTLHAGVYSQVARLMVVRLRKLIADEQITGSDFDIRRFRPRLADPTIGGWLDDEEMGDLATLGMTRDLLFHPQEHHYPLAEIEAITTGAGVTLLGAVVPQQVSRASRHRTGAALLPIRTFAQWRDLEWAYAGSLAMFEGWFQRA